MALGWLMARSVEPQRRARHPGPGRFRSPPKKNTRGNSSVANPNHASQTKRRPFQSFFFLVSPSLLPSAAAAAAARPHINQRLSSPQTSGRAHTRILYTHPYPYPCIVQYVPQTTETQGRPSVAPSPCELRLSFRTWEPRGDQRVPTTLRSPEPNWPVGLLPAYTAHGRTDHCSRAAVAAVVEALLLAGGPATCSYCRPGCHLCQVGRVSGIEPAERQTPCAFDRAFSNHCACVAAHTLSRSSLTGHHPPVGATLSQRPGGVRKARCVLYFPFPCPPAVIRVCASMTV